MMVNVHDQARRKKGQEFFCDPERIQTPFSFPVLAGLKADRNADALANPALYTNWQRVKDWAEESRYLQKTQAEAQQLFDAVADPANGVMQWIRLRW